MLLQMITISSPPLQNNFPTLLPLGSLKFRPFRLSPQALLWHCSSPDLTAFRSSCGLNMTRLLNLQIYQRKFAIGSYDPTRSQKFSSNLFNCEDNVLRNRLIVWVSAFSYGQISLLISAQVAQAHENVKIYAHYEVKGLFELVIQLSYLLLLLTLLGVGTFFVICRFLVRRELDLSAKEL